MYQMNMHPVYIIFVVVWLIFTNLVYQRFPNNINLCLLNNKVVMFAYNTSFNQYQIKSTVTIISVHRYHYCVGVCFLDDHQSVNQSGMLSAIQNHSVIYRNQLFS